MPSLMPKFLTRDVAEAATMTAMALVFDENNAMPRVTPKRRACHIVVMVPAVVARSVGSPPCYERSSSIEPAMLYEQSLNAGGWEWDFKGIARSKAVQLARGANNGGTDIQPHLMYEGDSPYWGGVRRDGIIVACSGIEPWFDRMIAGMIADMCVAMAYDAWMKSNDKAADVCFLGEKSVEPHRCLSVECARSHEG